MYFQFEYIICSYYNFAVQNIGLLTIYASRVNNKCIQAVLVCQM